MEKYSIHFKPKALKDLRSVQHTEQARILDKIELLTENLQGDVKKLTSFTPEYRLRIGSWRVLFEVTDFEIIIYRIIRRDKAYR